MIRIYFDILIGTFIQMSMLLICYTLIIIISGIKFFLKPKRIIFYLLILIALSSVLSVVIIEFKNKLPSIHLILPMVAIFVFQLVISISKHNLNSIYEQCGFNSIIDFVYEILFAGLQLTIAIIFGKKALENKMIIPWKYYFVSIIISYVFKYIFWRCGKKFSVQESFKNNITFLFSMNMTLIVLAFLGFGDLKDNFWPIYLGYGSLIGGEILFISFLEYKNILK